jgi:UDP-glucuronate 4-epimerase
MKILLTGGGGFIGSHLLQALLARGDQVVVLDNFDPFYPETRKRANLLEAGSAGDFHLVETDIRDPTGLRDAVPADVEGIVHLAARAGVRPSIEDPVLYQEVNVRGTQNLLELARDRGIGHFVFASSSSVYGINPKVPWSEDDHVLLPISPYASTKLSGELLGHVYSHLFGIRFIALRFFTVYGPRQRPDLAIHKFTRLMLEGRPIPMFGDGRTRRDYTYIDDIVSGILGAIDYRDSMYEVVNLGNNRTVSLAEMIGALEDVLGISALVEQRPEQQGDVPVTWADVERAHRLFGYAPATPFEEGLSHFRDWLQTDGIPAGQGT